MPREIQQILDAIGEIVASPLVQLGVQLAALYVVLLWLAGAYWAFRDMQLRTDNPFLPYLAAAFIILFTPLLFPFAIVLYRIVRPQEKIGEVHERELAEEALLAEVEAIRTCPTCGRRVHEEWLICPSCRTRLNRVCPNCSRLVGLDWSLCAWCGRDFERREAAAYEAIPGGLEAERLPGEETRPAVRAAAAGATLARPVRPSSGARRPAPDVLPDR